MTGLPRTFAIVAAAIAAVIGAGIDGPPFALPVPLYLPAGPAGPCCLPNTPRLPLLSLFAGLALFSMIAVGPLSARLIRGVALGATAAMYAGLVRALVMSWTNSYITTSYRVYALLFVCGVTFAIVVWAWSTLRRGGSKESALFALAAVGIALLLQVAQWDVVALGPSVAAIGGVATAEILPRVPRVRAALDGARAFAMRPAVLLGAILIVTVLFRLLFGLQTLARSGPGMAFAINSDDGDSYWRLASELVADPGQLLETIRTPAFPPAYTLMLAGVLGATGGRLEAVILVQALLAAAAGAAVYAIARTVLPVAIALAAASIFAIDANLIQNGATLTAEALLMPALLVSIAAFLRYRESGQGRWFCLALFGLGLAYVTRNVAAMPLIIAVVLWLIAWHRRRPLRLVRDVALVGLAVVIFSAPIAIATTVIEGRPRLTTQVAELAFNFVGNEWTISNAFLLDRGIRPFNDPADSVRRVLEDPLPVIGFLVGSVPQRLGTLLFFQAPGSSDPLLILNAVSYPNAWGDLITLARLLALLLVLALVVVRAPLRRHPTVSLCLIFCVLYVAIFLFVFAPYHAFRYRIPIEPLRFIAEVAGLALIVRYAFYRRTPPPTAL